MKLDVNNISKYFGEGSNRKKAIDGISFSISSGEFKTLVGSSGSGKSTILRIIAGLESPSKGNVKVDGKIISGPGLDRGMVFQKYSLFPWLTASENIAFGMNLNSYKLKEIKYMTSYLLEVVGLQDSGNKYPKELSGGMQQRIAIARALATNPKILLLDEPFGALDLQIRESMQKFLYELWKKTSLTVLLITHDIEEALALSQQICILAPNPGRIIKEVRVNLQKGDFDKLKLEKEKLELALYKSLPQLKSKIYSLNDISKEIPEDAVLIEFQKYRPYIFIDPDQSMDETTWGEAKYQALILFPNNKVESVDLGKAAEIDQLISLGLVSSEQSLIDAQDIWHELGSKIIKPLEKYIKNKKFNIKVKKNIPQSSGMGGGSMNAASILNYLFKKRI